LTLVLPRREGCPVSLLASAGLDTLAVRVPRHPVATRLLKAFGGPIAAPSANPSGRLSPTTAAHVAEGLGDRVAMILDDGPTAIGLESTVIDLSRPDRGCCGRRVDGGGDEAVIGSGRCRGGRPPRPAPCWKAITRRRCRCA
jgi:L-threonylcarbamoyladenylate synthase